MTNAIDRLVADGLVVRRQHPTDGRVTLGALTAKGRRLAAIATKTLNGEVFEATGLSNEQASELVAQLRELQRQAGDFEVALDAPLANPSTLK